MENTHTFDHQHTYSLQDIIQAQHTTAMLLYSAISYIIFRLHVCPLSKQLFGHLQVTSTTSNMKCCLSILKYNNTSQYTHQIDSQHSSHSYYSLLAYIIVKTEKVLEGFMCEVRILETHSVFGINFSPHPQQQLHQLEMSMYCGIMKGSPFILHEI